MPHIGPVSVRVDRRLRTAGCVPNVELPRLLRHGKLPHFSATTHVADARADDNTISTEHTRAQHPAAYPITAWTIHDHTGARAAHPVVDRTERNELHDNARVRFRQRQWLAPPLTEPRPDTLRWCRR